MGRCIVGIGQFGGSSLKGKEARDIGRFSLAYLAASLSDDHRRRQHPIPETQATFRIHLTALSNVRVSIVSRAPTITTDHGRMRSKRIIRRVHPTGLATEFIGGFALMGMGLGRASR
jgi:hypothetical protein